MLQELYCRNYKAFKDETVFPLCPLTVVVGPNNAGKSSVLDLVRLMSGDGHTLRGLNLSSSNDRLRSFRSLVSEGNSDSLEIGVRAAPDITLDISEETPKVHLADDISVRATFEAFGKNYVQQRREVSLHPQGGTEESRTPVFSTEMQIGPLKEEDVEPGESFEEIFGKRYQEKRDSNDEKPASDIWAGISSGGSGIRIKREAPEQNRPEEKLFLSPSGPYKRRVVSKVSVQETLINLATQIVIELGGYSFDVEPKSYEAKMGGWQTVNSEEEVPRSEYHGLGYVLSHGDIVPGWFPSEEEEVWRLVRDRVLIPLADQFDKKPKLNSTFLPSFRADPKRHYGPGDPLTPLLQSYQNAHPLTKEEVEKWLQTFEIGADLQVENVAPDLFAASVWRNGGQRYLADLGSGTAQLLPLILKLAAEKPSGILLLEEPEANLHPNHQARLADLIVELMNEGHQIMVETHSEYLVRRLQYLVATKECEPEHTSVLYIDSLKGGEKNSPDVRNISIDEYGQLSEPFGSGFFDQATDLMVDLFEYGSSN